MPPLWLSGGGGGREGGVVAITSKYIVLRFRFIRRRQRKSCISHFHRRCLGRGVVCGLRGAGWGGGGGGLLFTEYLPLDGYDQVEHARNLDPPPTSHRTADQDRGLYRWPSEDRMLFDPSSASTVSESSIAAPCKKKTPYKRYLCTRLTINNQHTPIGSPSPTATPLRSAATIDPRSAVRRLALDPAPRLATDPARHLTPHPARHLTPHPATPVGKVRHPRGGTVTGDHEPLPCSPITPPLSLTPPPHEHTLKNSTKVCYFRKGDILSTL